MIVVGKPQRTEGLAYLGLDGYFGVRIYLKEQSMKLLTNSKLDVYRY